MLGIVPPVALDTVTLSVTGTIDGVTVMLSTMSAQFCGVNLSQSLYVTGYTPGVVPAAIVTTPVVVFKVIPAGHEPTMATVALPLPPKVAGKPLTWSFEAMFGIVPPVTLDTVTLSVTGKIDGVTVI